MKLWQKNILAILLGALIGANYNQLSSLKIFGDLFIDISKMIAIPLIFVMIIKSITSLAKNNEFKHLLTKSIVVFLSAAAVASFIGIVTPVVLLHLPMDFSFAQYNNGLNTLTNGLAASLNKQIIQVVLLAIFVAYGLLSIESNFYSIHQLIDEVSTLLFKMLSYILQFAPFAVFTYSIWLAGNLDMETISKLAKFLQILFIAYILQLVLLAVYLKLYAQISPKHFFVNSFEYQLLAFSTGSSKAILPFTIQETVSKLNISALKANLLIPLASSINVAGLSIYLSSMAIFLADFYNVDLLLPDYLTILIISVVAPIGAAGIAGGALLVIPILLTSLNLPIEALVLMTAIDPIINGVRTAMNVTVDVGMSLALDKR